MHYRVVGAREQGDTFRDFVDENLTFLAPSLAWQMRPETRVLAQIEITHSRRRLDSGLALLDASRSLPAERFLGEPAHKPGLVQALTAQLGIATALNDSWEMEFDLQFQDSQLRGVGVEPSDFSNDRLSRERQSRDDSVQAWVVQAEVSGPVVFAGYQHDVLVGLQGTLLDEHVQLAESDSDQFPFSIDPFAPVYGSPLPALQFTRRSQERRQQLSGYVRDIWRINERWQVLMAGRVDHIDQAGSERVFVSRFKSTITPFTPRFSAIYSAPAGWIAYASYSESVDPNEGLTPSGRALKPTRARAVETGLRWSLFDKRIFLDSALFGVRQSDVTQDAPGNPGFEIQNARQDHFGIDLEAEYKPRPNVALTARYSYLDSSLVNVPDIPDGTPALNAPAHQASLLASVSTTLRRENDLRFGLALNYVGQRQASLEPEELGLRLDGYVRADMFLAWQASRTMELSVRIQNVTDTNYTAGSESDALRVWPGSPLDVRGEISLRF